ASAVLVVCCAHRNSRDLLIVLCVGLRNARSAPVVGPAPRAASLPDSNRHRRPITVGTGIPPVQPQLSTGSAEGRGLSPPVRTLTDPGARTCRTGTSYVTAAGSRVCAASGRFGPVGWALVGQQTRRAGS